MERGCISMLILIGISTYDLGLSSGKWIEIKGCHSIRSAAIQNQTRLPANEPGGCLEWCGTRTVALQLSTCFCVSNNLVRKFEYACSQNCIGDARLKCGGVENDFVSVYRERYDINAEWGSIEGSGCLSYMHTSNEIGGHLVPDKCTVKHPFFCYSEMAYSQGDCYRHSNINDKRTWYEALEACRSHNPLLLWPAEDVNNCSVNFIADEIFWVAVYQWVTVQPTATSLSTIKITQWAISTTSTMLSTSTLTKANTSTAPVTSYTLATSKTSSTIPPTTSTISTASSPSTSGSTSFTKSATTSTISTTSSSSTSTISVKRATTSTDSATSSRSTSTSTSSTKPATTSNTSATSSPSTSTTSAKRAIKSTASTTLSSSTSTYSTTTVPDTSINIMLTNTQGPSTSNGGLTSTYIDVLTKTSSISTTTPDSTLRKSTPTKGTPISTNHTESSSPTASSFTKDLPNLYLGIGIGIGSLVGFLVLIIIVCWKMRICTRNHERESKMKQPISIDKTEHVELTEPDSALGSSSTEEVGTASTVATKESQWDLIDIMATYKIPEKESVDTLHEVLSNNKPEPIENLPDNYLSSTDYTPSDSTSDSSSMEEIDTASAVQPTVLTSGLVNDVMAFVDERPNTLNEVSMNNKPEPIENLQDNCLYPTDYTPSDSTSDSSSMEKIDTASAVQPTDLIGNLANEVMASLEKLNTSNEVSMNNKSEPIENLQDNCLYPPDDFSSDSTPDYSSNEELGIAPPVPTTEPPLHLFSPFSEDEVAVEESVDTLDEVPLNNNPVPIENLPDNYLSSFQLKEAHRRVGLNNTDSSDIDV